MEKNFYYCESEVFSGVCEIRMDTLLADPSHESRIIDEYLNWHFTFLVLLAFYC